MINFADLTPIAGANITEPVSKGRSIALSAFKEGMQSLEKSIADESQAMRAVADELYKSGKVDFMGGDISAFKNRYSEEKAKLVNELKGFSSVQAFLNNGGYEKIAEFKNNLETSEEYQRGVQNKLQFETIRALQAKGYSKFKFEEGQELDKWLSGESNVLGFKGMYNHDPIDPKRFQIGKGKEQVYAKPEEVREYMKVANYSEEDIKSAEEMARQNSFIKIDFDETAAIRQAQLENTIENTASLKQARIDKKNYDDAILKLKQSASAYKQQVIASNWDDWVKDKPEIPYTEFAKAPKFYRTETVNTTTKEKLSGANAENAIIEKTATKVDYVIDDNYILLPKGEKIHKPNAKPRKVEGALKNGEAYYNVRTDAWYIPAKLKSGVEVTLIRPVNAQKSETGKSSFMLDYDPNKENWQAMANLSQIAPPPPNNDDRSKRPM